MKKFIKENWIAMIPYVMFVIMIIVMGALNSNTLSIRYIANKSDAALSLILVAAGQTLVLLTGGFDLSVGGVICITNCLAASRMQNSVGSMLIWAVICLAVGVGIGALNGFVIEKTKMQPFIVTLATQYVCYGIALLIMKVDGGNVPAAYISTLLHRFGPLPLSMFIIAALALVWMFFKNTKKGFSIYAIGSNESAARLNGISIMKTKILAYGLSGAFAALAGLFRTAQVASGSPTAGAELCDDFHIGRGNRRNSAERGLRRHDRYHCGCAGAADHWRSAGIHESFILLVVTGSGSLADPCGRCQCVRHYA